MASANLEHYSSYSRERTYKHTLLRERTYKYTLLRERTCKDTQL